MNQPSGAAVTPATSTPFSISERGQIIIANLVMLAVLVGFFVLALDYSPRAQAMPLIVSGISIVIVLAELGIVVFMHRTEGMAIDTAELFGTDRQKEELAATVESLDGTEAMEEAHPGTESAAFLWLGGLGAMIFVLGFQFTIFVYPILFLLAHMGRHHWRLAVITGAMAWLALFVLFTVILKLEFFPGVLMGGEW